MKHLKRWPLILVSLFIFQTTAQAGFLMEPYLGYAWRTNGEDPNVENGDIKVAYHGFNVGARIGFRMSMFMIGIDGDWMKHKAAYEVSDGTTRPEREKYNFGAYMGLRWGAWSIRGTWYWASTWKFKSDNLAGYSTECMTSGCSYKTNGKGFGAAVAWQFYDYFALNLDYRMQYYDELGGVDVESFNPGEMIISISLPFDLGVMMNPEKPKDPWAL